MTGNAAVNRVVTQGGDDTIDVYGDPGNEDVVYCGAGLDTVTFDDGDDWIDLTDLSCGLPPPQVPVAPPPPSLAPFVPQPPLSSPPRPVRGGPDALVAAVAQELAQASRTLQRCGTTGLLSKPGCRDSFTALRPGTVVYRLTTAGAGTRAASSGTLLASGRKAIRAAGSYPVKIKATKKGRRRLSKARKLRATLTVTFTDSRGNIAKRSTAVVLRRRNK